MPLLKKNYLFAYGSLLTGSGVAPIDRLMRKADLISPGYVQGRLYDLGDYPGVVLSRNPEERVWGRVYRMPSTAWAALDDYEGIGKINPRSSEFVRQNVDVFCLDTPEKLSCWIYVYNGKPSRRSLIPGGDYIAHRTERKTGGHIG